MAQVMDYVAYLAKEIGARPAGTEEEQQAALYITEQFQKEIGFTANIEEFSSSSNFDGGRTVLALVAIVVTVLAMIFPVLAIPAFVLAAAAAAIYTLEAFDRPIVSRALSHGASQNVVAKYQPNHDEDSDGESTRPRSRKIVLVAHYDTGRVTPPLVERAQSFNLPLPLICVGGMIATAFLLLIRIFVAPGGGMGLLVLNILSVLALLVCVLPVVKALLMRSAPYNEGANNNATGTAALLEVARRISRGRVSEADLAQNADAELRIHGEAAAREAGLIPEGVQIRYEAEQLMPPSELGQYDEEERLLAAKAAIAALTGKPIERRVYGSVADKLVNSRVGEVDAGYVDPNDAEGAAVNMPVYVPDEQPASAEGGQPSAPATADGFENAPSWFVAAQQNAKRSSDEAAPIQRSKYTEAMEQADRARAEREAELRAAEQAQREAEARAREAEARAALEADAATRDAASAPAPAAVPSSDSAPAPDAGAAPESSESAPDSAAPSPAPALVEEPAPAPTPASSRPRVARERITNLPAIDAAAPARPSNSAQPASPAPVTSPSRSGMLRKLRTNVPSLSGLITPIKDDQTSQKSTAGTSNTAAANAQREAARRVAADAVPTVVNVPTTEPEPVDYDMEVPRSRAGNLLKNIRGGKADELADTPQEWLDIDGDFDARTVGRERGSWESFRDDQLFGDDEDIEEFGTGDEPRGSRRWNGGAYSRMQLGHVNMRSGAESEADEIIPEELPETEVDRSLTGEIEQIYHFRNPQFNTEIWFVAMGADGEGHDGARAFLEAHAEELRGSMVIEVESLGAGALSVASEEGRVRKVTASSRVKRYTRNAVTATGIALDSVSLAGSDSIASVVQKAGFQSMHLFGAENGCPALKGSADDIVENLDELLLDDHVNFVFELLKQP